MAVKNPHRYNVVAYPCEQRGPYPTKNEAVKAARACAAGLGEPVEVYCHDRYAPYLFTVDAQGNEVRNEQ